MRILFCLTLVLLSATSFLHAQENPFTVTNLSAEKYKDGEVTLVFETYDFMLAMLEKEKNDNNWSAERFEKEKTRLPKGGVLKFLIQQKEQEAAKPSNSKVVVKDESGKELYRGMLGAKEPEKVGKFWQADKWIRMEEQTLPSKFTVSLINRITNNQYDYTVEMKK